MKFFFLNTPLPKRSLLLFAAVLFLLSAVSSWYFSSQPSVKQQQKKLQKYLNDQQNDAAELIGDTVLMRKLVLQSESIEDFKRITAKGYGFFLFAETISEQQDPLFWNTQKILPVEADFSRPDGSYGEPLLNGFYVIQKKTIRLHGMTNNIVAYVLIPVLQKYYLATSYFPTRFLHDEAAVDQIALLEDTTGVPIYSKEGPALFSIKRVAHSNIFSIDVVTLLLRIAAFILLLVYVQLLTETISRKKGSSKAVIFLFAVLVMLRVCLFLFPQLFSLRQFPLFDPSIYASNRFNRSLGDLLLNAIVCCWVIVFAWYSLGPNKRLPVFIKGRWVMFIGIASTFLLIFSTFQFANVVNDLITNSKISFSVTEFFSLNIYTIYGFFVLALLAVAYYYFSRLLFRIILAAFPNLIHLYFAVAIIGLIFLTVRTGESIVLFHLPVLLWLVIYTLLLSQQSFIINRFRITTAGVLFWIFIYSASLSLLVLNGNREKELLKRKSIAEKYDQLTDRSRENIFNIVLVTLDNRFLSQNFQRFYTETQSRRLRDSIISDNFSALGNQYDNKIYLFDTLRNPLHNDDRQSYAELNTLFTMQGKPTDVKDLSFIETSYDKFTYITKRTITDTATKLIGTLFILSTSRQYQTTDALYPEFFKQVNLNDPENSPSYSYAIYRDKILANHSSKYPFIRSITDAQLPTDEVEYRTRDGNDELWYRSSNRKTIVVAKQKNTLIESITLFSYLFCAFLFLVGLLRACAFLIKLASGWKLMANFSNINIRSQIHGTIIFISVLSFIIIGIATISFFIQRYNRNNIDRLSRTASVTVNEMQKRIDGANMLSGFSFSDSAAIAGLKTLVKEIADVHNVDANVYDLQGNLQVSSYDEVYTRGILSSKMHPLAYFGLNNLQEVQRVQEESLSSLSYLSIYTSIRDNKGVVYAYLNIPYFSSQLDLKQEISNFFVTIINLNAFIFLLAGVIALFITNRITRSFSIIGDKMKEITLGKTAEEIVWTKDDEIGELVKQYNKMVHQLEQSAEALAKSEREGAWREMARQVAHEIKNPLTPMKLSIQYLQKSIQNNQPNVQQLTTNVANTLIEQIDHLSKIAADFSQFANIGNKKLEKMDLHAVVGSLVDLYAANPRMRLEWNRLPMELLMRTDKTHMNRLFTNLLSNAVDACSERRECKVTINEVLQDDFVIVSIVDNGEGILADMQSKIFTPNFTTKTSGTGLGLAMCKNIAEQAGGSIWFETKEGEGTTFFIQLPLVE